jgi:hypothetical protein
MTGVELICLVCVVLGFAAVFAAILWPMERGK